MSKTNKNAKKAQDPEVDDVEDNGPVPDLKKKKKVPASGSKTASKKPATKKTKAKKAGSKTAKKASGSKKKHEGTVRYFKRIDGKTLKSHGRYTGVTPKQAASKGFTKMVQKYKKSGKAVPKSLTIFLRESTRGSSGKVYGYTAERQKLSTPQELTIVDTLSGDEKKITYEYRNKIRKGVIPDQIGGMKKKKPSSKEKKAKKSKKPKSAKAGKKASSGSKTAKPKKSKAKKPKAKAGSKTAKK